MKKGISLLFCFILLTSFSFPTRYGRLCRPKGIVVWQPSHQTDTGIDFSEAKTCNAIVEAAMKAAPRLVEYKVWSLNEPNLHHATVGSNTIIEHTTAVSDGMISGYAYELKESNQYQPDVFIAIHNNGGTKRHAIWGFVHDGDPYEAENKALAARLVAAISSVTDLENKGVHLDSSTGRNDYRCKATGKRAFFSLDEQVNTAKYRVLLEIGDNSVSKAFLENPENQQKMGTALKLELQKFMIEKNLN